MWITVNILLSSGCMLKLHPYWVQYSGILFLLKVIFHCKCNTRIHANVKWYRCPHLFISWFLMKVKIDTSKWSMYIETEIRSFFLLAEIILTIFILLWIEYKKLGPTLPNIFLCGICRLGAFIAQWCKHLTDQ